MSTIPLHVAAFERAASATSCVGAALVLQSALPQREASMALPRDAHIAQYWNIAGSFSLATPDVRLLASHVSGRATLNHEEFVRHVPQWNAEGRLKVGLRTAPEPELEWDL